MIDEQFIHYISDELSNIKKEFEKIKVKHMPKITVGTQKPEFVNVNKNKQVMKKYKVLFADLDGTLIETISGDTFPKGIWDMRIRFDVLDAIKQLNPDFVFIISNQGGIELGYVKNMSFVSKCNYVRYIIEDYCGNNIRSAFSYCKSNDKNNPRRKPNTGMIEDFYHGYIEGFDFNKKDALMIGDASGKEGQFSDSDKKTAENFGIDYLDVEDFVKGMRYENNQE